MVDDLFSTKGWCHQKSGSAYGGGGDVIYVPMKKLARWSCKLIFDKQDRFVHPAAIARMTEKKRKKIHHIAFPQSSLKRNADL